MKRKFRQRVLSLGLVLSMCLSMVAWLGGFRVSGAGLDGAPDDNRTLVCERAEHAHDATCYASDAVSRLDCQYVVHRHNDSEGCFDEFDGSLICRRAEFVLHKHDSNCCDDTGLVCALDEIYVNYADGIACGIDSQHEHDESCYEMTLVCGYDNLALAEIFGDLDADVVPVHEHDEGCYERTLVCQEHVHDDSCLGRVRVLIWNDDVRDYDENLIMDTHQHEAACFVETGVGEQYLVCGMVEHMHTDDCYLISGVPEEPEEPENPGDEDDNTDDETAQEQSFVYFEAEVNWTEYADMCANANVVLPDTVYLQLYKGGLPVSEDDGGIQTVTRSNPKARWDDLEKWTWDEDGNQYWWPYYAVVVENAGGRWVPVGGIDNTFDGDECEDAVKHLRLKYSSVSVRGDVDLFRHDDYKWSLVSYGPDVTFRRSDFTTEVYKCVYSAMWLNGSRRVYDDGGVSLFTVGPSDTYGSATALYYCQDIGFESPRFVVGKKDAGTGAPVAGVEFCLTLEGSVGSWYSFYSEKNYVTDVAGLIYIFDEVVPTTDGSSGDTIDWLLRRCGSDIFSFREVSCPDEYVLDDTVYSFDMLQDAGWVVTNARKSGVAETVYFEATKEWVDYGDDLPDGAYLQLYKGGLPVSDIDGGIKYVTPENPVARWDGLEKYTEVDGEKRWWPYYVIEVVPDDAGGFVPVGGVTDSFHGCDDVSFGDGQCVVSYDFVEANFDGSGGGWWLTHYSAVFGPDGFMESASGDFGVSAGVLPVWLDGREIENYGVSVYGGGGDLLQVVTDHYTQVVTNTKVESQKDAVFFTVVKTWFGSADYENAYPDDVQFDYALVSCFQLYKDGVPVSDADDGIRFLTYVPSPYGHHAEASVSWQGLEKYAYDSDGNRHLVSYCAVELLPAADGSYVPVGGIRDSSFGCVGIDDVSHILVRYGSVCDNFDNEYEVGRDGEGYRQYVQNEHPMAVVRKVDAVTGDPISGVTFRVALVESEVKPSCTWDKSAYLHFVKDYVTDADGLIYVFDEPLVHHGPFCSLYRGFDDYLNGFSEYLCNCDVDSEVLSFNAKRNGLAFKEMSAAQGYVLDDSVYYANLFISEKEGIVYRWMELPFDNWTVSNEKESDENETVSFEATKVWCDNYAVTYDVDVSLPDTVCFQLVKDGNYVSADDDGVRFLTRDSLYNRPATVRWDGLDKYTYAADGSKRLCKYEILELVPDSDGNFRGVSARDGHRDIDYGTHVFTFYTDVNMESDVYSQTVYNEIPLIILRKEDAETGKPISQTYFKLVVSESESMPIYVDGMYFHVDLRVYTDKNGLIYIFNDRLVGHMGDCPLAAGLDYSYEKYGYYDCDCPVSEYTLRDILARYGIGGGAYVREVRTAPGYILDKSSHGIFYDDKGDGIRLVGSRNWVLTNQKSGPIHLEFIKADSRGKPANSFADGSRVPEAISANDGVFAELGTSGPSYEWLAEHGYLVDGALFGITYDYYDENGQYKTGKQACWSGCVVNPPVWTGGDELFPERTDFANEWAYQSACSDWRRKYGWDETRDYAAYMEWKDYVVSVSDMPKGKLRFTLPASTVDWRLTEVWCESGSGYEWYNDAGIIESCGDKVEGDLTWDIRGSGLDAVVMHYWSDVDRSYEVFVERNPGYQAVNSGISLFVDLDEFRYPYTGNILWNDCVDVEEDFIELRFIKADSRGKPANSFADGSRVPEAISANDGVFAELGTSGPSYEWLAEHGYLLNGALFGLEYYYEDEDGDWQSDKLACWSGGVENIPGEDSAYRYLYDEWAPYIVTYDDANVLDGELVFRVPANVFFWNLDEIVAPNGYVWNSFGRYNDAGVLGYSGSVGGRYDSGMLCMYVSYTVGHTIHFVEENPGCVGDYSVRDDGVLFYGGERDWQAAYTGNILWNDAVEPEYEGTKLTFVKANSKYRPSLYDVDGSFVEDYKVATFNDGDIEADYQYLLALDEQYGDVLIDGVEFRLSYETPDGKIHYDSCWAGGVNSDGELVNDGCDSQGYPLRHGEVVFYLPDDAVVFYSDDIHMLWRLTEREHGIVRYSDTDFAVVNDSYLPEIAYYNSSLVMLADAESPYDLSAVLYKSEGAPRDCGYYWEPYSGIQLFGGGGYSSSRPYTGNIIWNNVMEPEFDGTKLIFVKANSKYRPSPYNADGTLVEDYKVATFNDGDIEADYQYLLDLDEQYGDVLIDGIEFELRYRTSDGWQYVTCWSGGVDADGELVNGGLDAMGVPIEHGQAVFYVPDGLLANSLNADNDFLSIMWELYEHSDKEGSGIGYYSNTSFVVDDANFDKGTTYLAMRSSSKNVSDLSMILYGGSGCKHWESYSGISLYGGFGENPYSVRSYTGNIIWNDVDESGGILGTGISLPSTGAPGFTPVILGCGTGLLVIAAAAVVYKRKRRGTK